jgi:hypothetical protein
MDDNSACPAFFKFQGRVRQMLQKSRPYTKIMVVLTSVLMLCWFSDTGALQPDATLLQFKAGNHILGFGPNKAYLASTDHALSVEFLGTKGVMPKADSGIAPDKTMAKAMPLTKVVYQNLWEGISLTYTASKDGITESIYHVAPGADVSKIRLKYNVPVAIQKNGTLRFKFDKGFLAESAPVAWQDIDGKRIPVKVAFRINKDEVGFETGKYDPKHPLTIDPTYAWHTFYGQSGDDYGTSVAVDSSGNVYIAGYSSASWTGPVTAVHPDPIHSHSGSNDIFVLKLDSSGNYQWHTFYGSTGSETNPSIAADRNGNVYVGGSSIYGWQGDGNISPKHAAAGGGWSNFFVLKLNSAGAYQWHTFYGGSANNSTATSIALDSNGNAHVAGYCTGTWFGASGESPLRAYRTGGADVCVIKLTSSGEYAWHTFYGSDINDWAYGIAVDGSSNVYVTGFGLAAWTGTPTITPINAFNGVNYDMFVLKLNSSGAHQWHTFHGSSNNDYGYAIAVDNSSNVYVTGSGISTWGSNVIDAHSANADRHLLKLNSNGVYQWNTFWAGGSGDSVGIALDKNNNIYVTGYDWLTWGTSPLHSHTSGDYDITVAKFNTGGARMWNTFYGAASAEDKGVGIAVDVNGSVIVTGTSAATWQGDGVTPPTDPLHTFNAANDIFVLKLALTTCPSSAAHINGGTSFTTMQDAYNNSIDGSLIQLQALTFDEPDMLVDSGDDIRVTLRGGYECDFLSNPGFSTLHGKMTISKGKVTIDSLIIK